MCLAFVVSWWNNRNLLSDIRTAANSQTVPKDRGTSLQDLQALDALRFQVARLQGGLPLRFHWGLYTGNGILDRARTTWFRQFHRLLLSSLNGQMVAGLQALSPSPDAAAPYDPAYRDLKAHLIITSGACPVDTPFLSQQLKEVRARIAPAVGSDWQVLADRQIDFYSSQLAQGNPLRVPEDIEARERARQYLRQLKGIDRLYAGILASAEKSVAKTARLHDLASNYTQVLSGPDEVSSAFSPAGWAYLVKASKEANAAALGEPCVVGGPSGVVANYKQNTETAQAIQRLYLRDYVDRWRKFVEGFSVTKYASAADAARKLEILSDHKSPLLAVFVMTANATNFPPPAAPTDVVKQNIGKLVAPFKKAETDAKAMAGAPAEAPDSLNTSRRHRKILPARVRGGAALGATPGSWTRTPPTSKRSPNSAIPCRILPTEAKHVDPAVSQAASQNYEKALDAVRQIARAFKPVGVGGLDGTVVRLLEEPIRPALRFIPRPGDPITETANKANRDLRTFCTSQSNTLGKYPFQPSSTDDVSLEEFGAIFHPATGAIWKLQQQSLAELYRQGGRSVEVQGSSQEASGNTRHARFSQSRGVRCERLLPWRCGSGPIYLHLASQIGQPLDGVHSGTGSRRTASSVGHWRTTPVHLATCAGRQKRRSCGST